MTRNERHRNYARSAAMILSLVAALVYFGKYQNAIYQKEIQPVEVNQSQESVGICVVSIDLGSDRIFRWSNRRATPNEDGTVTISTASDGGF